jgi:hypothetical protein
VPDQPNSDRFKSEMPHIPGVSSGPATNVSAPRKPPMGSPPIGMIAAVAVVVFFVLAGAHFAMRAKHADAPVAAAPPQLEVPPPAPDPAASLPHVTSSDPVVASVAEMTTPWSSKEFFMQDALTGENIQSLLIRLPSGSPTKPEGYWGLVMTAAYGSCQLEYITDMSRLRDDYGFKGASHAMIGDPCSRTVFDPTKMSALSGNIWVRGAIVQGADVRPPFGIELKIKDKNIQAIRRE